MLFDLRSRGRRRTVQVVYLGLAILMGGGLVLFGVGTGKRHGGMLNAFTGSGSQQPELSVISQQKKAALKQTKTDAQHPAAWAALVQARYDSAAGRATTTTPTSTYTAAGKKELARAADAWQQLPEADQQPSPRTSRILAARAYGALGQYANEASAWEYVTQLASERTSRASNAWPSRPTPPSRPARATWPQPRR